MTKERSRPSAAMEPRPWVGSVAVAIINGLRVEADLFAEARRKQRRRLLITAEAVAVERTGDRAAGAALWEDEVEDIASMAAEREGGA